MMFLAIEINLILWLMVVGQLVGSPSVAGQVKTAAMIGFVVAAVVQHWAYYNIRKKPKQAHSTAAH